MSLIFDWSPDNARYVINCVIEALELRIELTAENLSLLLVILNFFFFIIINKSGTSTFGRISCF